MGAVQYETPSSDTSKDTDDHREWDEEQHVGLFSNIVKPMNAVSGEQSCVFIILFQVSRRELYNAAPSQSPEIKAPSVSEECTTWPVHGNETYKFRQTQRNSTLQSFAPRGGWKKPAGINVKALIFYGRRRTVDFLDCYLTRNLVDNGGYLDEVWFMLHTDNQEDLAYLDRLVSQRRRYRIVNPGECQGSSYGCIWDPVVEDDTIYIKIDDDIVFIHPDTIPQLVHTRIKEPHPYAVSANLVNSPLTGYKHYDAGAIHPFRPDPSRKRKHRASETWRPSEKPGFPTPKIPDIDEENVTAITEEVLDAHVEAEPPYRGHTWLLLPGGSRDLLKTPMGINKLREPRDGGEKLMGAAWHSWMIAAQQHYSLLQNLEDDAMWRYHFAGGGGVVVDGYPQGGESLAGEAALRHWDRHRLGPGAEQLLDTGYVRYNLNFVALWGHDVRAALPIAGDDEQDITVAIPERTGRPFVIDSRAVVAHIGFNPQQAGVRQTDLLDRWRAYANEMVCAPADRKRPFDGRCPGF
ncbi:hypothetical protein F5X99DRAFT_424011 [Biscogniauxia marginata]|nr:hypothetical protein F5X99DRAFT_424011 [Biscogniauxia marginata]